MIRPALFVLASLVLLPAAAAAQAAADAAQLFERLAGSWECTGAFADGRSLAADLTFTVADRSLHYSHVDRAPNTYRQDAIWGFDAPSGTIASAAVASLASERPTELSFYVADAWSADSVQLVARPLLRNPWAPNRFTYTLHADGRLGMVWEVGRNDEWRMGDYLDCQRQ